eukprot:2302861-Rhodomonas_salina.1
MHDFDTTNNVPDDEAGSDCAGASRQQSRSGQGESVLQVPAADISLDTRPSVTASSSGERVGVRTLSSALSDAQEQQATDAATQQAEQDSIRDPSDSAQAQRTVDPDNNLTQDQGVLGVHSCGDVLSQGQRKFPRRLHHRVPYSIEVQRARSAIRLQNVVGSCRGTAKWNIRSFLDICYNSPLTLTDIGLVVLPGEPDVSATLAAWCMLETLTSEPPDPQ